MVGGNGNIYREIKKTYYVELLLEVKYEPTKLTKRWDVAPLGCERALVRLRWGAI